MILECNLKHYVNDIIKYTKVFQRILKHFKLLKKIKKNISIANQSIFMVFVIRSKFFIYTNDILMYLI
jgi:hypothetical protein